MEERIIPFGKYKGKPVEVLASDEEYLNWLMDQSFFRERYLTLYNVVINNFRDPVDTPDHNRIQVRFLQQEYRLKMAFLLNPNLFQYNSEAINEAMLSILSGDDVAHRNRFLRALQNPLRLDWTDFGLRSRTLLGLPPPTFETYTDVYFEVSYGISFVYDGASYSRRVDFDKFNHRSRCSYVVEIKPTVGDDFPAILRQMNASMKKSRSAGLNASKYILLVGDYTGTGATKEEFVQFFNSQGFKVVFQNQVETTVLPEFESELNLRNDIEEMLLIDLDSFPD